MKPNIAIVGCGPTGMASAILLHDAGFSTTVFEQFAEPGPVGSGLMLQPPGLSVLDSMGLRSRTEELGQRIDGMLGRLSKTGKKVLDIRYGALSGGIYGVAIHRASLFDVLFEALCKRNISVVTDTAVFAMRMDTAPESNDGNGASYSLEDSTGKTIAGHFDLIVDASGAQSKLLENAKALPRRRPLEYGAFWTTVALNGDTFSRQNLEQRYTKASVMAGVLPCGRFSQSSREKSTDQLVFHDLATFFWSVKASDADAIRLKELEAWKQDVMDIWPDTREFLDQIKNWDQLVHAQYSHHTLKYPYGEGIVFVGDCAHATSPQLGQGANMGLLDAAALADAIRTVFPPESAQANGSLKVSKPNSSLLRSSSKSSMRANIKKAMELYAKKRRLHVRFYQSAGFLLTPFYQSDSWLLPFLRDLFFDPVSRLPFMRRIITGLGSGMMLKPLKNIQLAPKKNP